LTHWILLCCCAVFTVVVAVAVSVATMLIVAMLLGQSFTTTNNIGSTMLHSPPGHQLQIDQPGRQAIGNGVNRIVEIFN
jgi:hypothetical protein